MELYREWASTPLDVEPRISVVVPTYNEEWRILPTLGAIAHAMSERGEPWELIVSDDGSSDRTVALVKELDLPNLRLIESPNTGKGGAVRRGVLESRGEFVLFADADQSTPIEQFDSLLEPLEAGKADVAVGSRAADGADVSNKSLVRNILSSGLQVLVRYGFRIPVKDTQCGFKLFRRAAALDIFHRQRIDGFSFDLELLFLARKLGYPVAEVPVDWIDAPGSTVDPATTSILFLRDLVRIRMWALSGAYSASMRPSRPHAPSLDQRNQPSENAA